MIKIGIVGDIGSGKSFIAKQFGYPVFDADNEVRKIYRKDKKCFIKLNKAIPKHILSFPIKKKEIVVFGPKMVRPLMWVGEPARVYKIIIDENSDKFKSQIFNLCYENENYEKTLEILSSAKKTTDDFFENVVVNDENKNMKKNRLELLEMFCNTFDNFIDFSKIEGA